MFSDILKDMNFMAAIEYGLSNLISSLKNDREKQWKAIYIPAVCVIVALLVNLMSDQV